MEQRRSGLTRLDLVVLIITALVLAAVVFPLFAKTTHGSRGVVLSSENKPIPGAVLRFRDPTGRLVATITANENGYFRRKGLHTLSQNAVDGFVLTRVIRNSDYMFYRYSPQGEQQITFRGDKNKPLAGLAVSLRPDQQTWRTPSTPQIIEPITDGNGTIRLPNLPLGARFEIKSRDDRYVVRNVVTTPEHQIVRHAVSLVRSATITGRLRASNGNPLGGHSAFATSDPDLNRSKGQWYGGGVTGKSGRFRIVGLLPGTYYVGARLPLRSDRSVTSTTRRVTVASGQTVEVQLRSTKATQR